MKALALLLILVFLTQAVLGDGPDGLNGSSLKEVPVSEVLEKLASGEPAIYSGKIINGSLDLVEISFENESRIVKSSLVIKDSEIKGKVNSANLVFLGPVDFGGTIFHEDVSFIDVNFSQGASFNRSQFEKDAKFGLAKFHGQARFEDAIFKNRAQFGDVHFYKKANFAKSKIDRGIFSNAVFEGWGTFTAAEFQDKANLDRMTFNDSAFFDASKFLEKAFFDETKFNGSRNKNLPSSINFLEAKFNDDASFFNTTFIQDATFQNSRFLEEADFGKSKFLDTVDFNDTSFKGDASFWDAQFLGSIYLHGAKFSRLIVRWENLSGHLIFGEVLYLSLIDNFKKLGRTGDANDCYYEYMIKQPKDSGIWPRFVDFVKWISCGYGVRPERTVMVCTGVIALFGSLFWIGRGVNRSEESKQNTSRIAGFWKWTRSVYLLRCFYFSTTAFMGGKSDISPLGDYKYLATIERIFGWLFFGLFLATLTRTLLG